MSRSNSHILVTAAIAISTTGCALRDTSAPPDHSRTLQASHEGSSASSPSSVSTPPNPGPVVTGELGPAPAEASIDPKTLKAALGDPSVLAKLRDLALPIASNAGVSSPTKMYVVAVFDHQDAETILSGAKLSDHLPVYVIVMTGGRFTTADHPPGVPAPEGNVLTVTVAAVSHRVTDVGIVNVEPDLSKVALVTVDLGTK